MELLHAQKAMMNVMDENWSDEEVLGRIARGESQAVRILYERMSSQVYQFALQMSNSSSTAEDVTQDVFLFLLEQKIKLFDPGKGTVRSYLYGIARHMIWRKLRAQHTEGLAESAVPSSFISKVDDPYKEMSKAELVSRVQKAVFSLPPHYREVVVLVEFQEFSYGEVGAILRCSIGTVRSRLHRARALLWKKLSPRNLEESKGTSTNSGGTQYEMSAI